MKHKTKHSEPSWSKNHTYPCPGRCGHLHVKRTGPCTRIGCGCTATKKKSK